MQRLRAEAQVRGGHRAGLLGVVNEIALREVVGLFADDLDGVLVRAHRAVGAQAVEQRPHRARDFRGKLGVEVQAGVGDVVVDADREVVLRRRLQQLVEHRLHHRRREFLGRQPVASADHLLAGTPISASAVITSQIERLARRARFLGAVQNGDRFHAMAGSAATKRLHRERPVQPHLQHARPSRPARSARPRPPRPLPRPSPS